MYQILSAMFLGESREWVGVFSEDGLKVKT